MTNELIAKAKAHNQSIADFTAQLESKYGNRIPALTIFKVMSEYDEQRFYHKAEPIVAALRANGIKATINCQSGEINLPYNV